MKKSIIILLSLAAIFLTGCSGFLKEDPKTMLAESSAFGTDANVNANIIGIYQGIESADLWLGEFFEFHFINSGLLTRKSESVSSYGIHMEKFASVVGGSKEEAPFEALYAAVNRANNVIVNMQDESSPLEETFRKESEGEARLLRALLYFTITRLYGDSPLLLDATRSLEDAHSPRSPFWEIYKAVLDDLTFAEENMRDQARVNELTPGQGRPNKWAATALKSSVYLTIGSLLTDMTTNFWDASKTTPDFSACGIKSSADAFKLAYENATKVIQNGPYTLESDYRKLFRWTEPEDFMLNEGILILMANNTKRTELARRSMPQGYHTKNKNSNHGRQSPA